MVQRPIFTIVIILMMVQPSYSESGSQQIHSRIKLIINWIVRQIEPDFVILRLIANVEIWNGASSNQELIFPFDCTSKLKTNIILENSSLYEGIDSECFQEAEIREYVPGLTTDTFSVDIIFNDPDLRTLPDGSYDVWLPVNGGKSLVAQIIIVEGSSTITYQSLLEGWGVNDERVVPYSSKQNDDNQLEPQDIVQSQETLTSTLVTGDALQYSFGIGILALTVGIIIFIRKNDVN